jgi:hypothetical protein
VFYRTVQVARDRFDAAICCGTSAVAKRSFCPLHGIGHRYWLKLAA